MENGEADERLVRALLHEQRPHLAGLPLRHVAAGLDNGIWRLGDDLSVRLPRTPHAVSLLRNEQRWLPVLAPHLPLPVPTSVHDGRPSARFPKPWTITTWVTGEPADRSPIRRGHQAADALAGFLRALHRSAPANAPTSPKRGVPLGGLTERFDERLRVAAPGGVPAEVGDVWADAVAAPLWEGPPVWLHADLHPANVVVSGGALAGVLDFGELCTGDPATDLAAAWLLLPAESVARFFDAYANADTATIRRARGWAVLFGLSLVGVGLTPGRNLPTWEHAGRTALTRVLAPDM